MAIYLQTWLNNYQWTADHRQHRINQGGYEDLLSPTSDHCWIWADSLIGSILGGNLDLFMKPISRKLSCKLPRVKEKYQKILEKEFLRHKLQTRLEEHIDKYTKEYKQSGILTDKMKKEYDKLHQLSEDAIKHADRTL